MTDEITAFQTFAFSHADAPVGQDYAVCFSGHREIPAQEYDALSARLDAALLRLIEGGYSHFYAGGAIGFDTMAAEAILRLRAGYPHIRLHLILPCHGQENRWSADNRAAYRRILAAADHVLYATPGGYTPGCMQLRDRRLVDDSSVCLCYLTRANGGTAYTVGYARRRGLSVINLAVMPDTSEKEAAHGNENSIFSGKEGLNAEQIGDRAGENRQSSTAWKTETEKQLTLF